MASPKFSIDGQDSTGVIRESWTTNNRATAETYAETYAKRYGVGRIYRLTRIAQGVAVYEPLKEYGKGKE